MASSRTGISIAPGGTVSGGTPEQFPVYATTLPDGTKVISHAPIQQTAPTVAQAPADNSQLIKYALIGLAVYFLLKK